MTQDRNEASVIQDIAQLIVPSAQSLALRGTKHLKYLIENVNEDWNNSFHVTQTRSQQADLLTLNLSTCLLDLVISKQVLKSNLPVYNSRSTAQT